MRSRFIHLALFVFVGSSAAQAQVSRESRFQILGILIADNAASRIAMPFGNDGVRLSDKGVIDEEKLLEELREEGRSIEKGQVVTITAINFDDDKIEVELDGGGKNQKSFFDRIQFGVGVGDRSVARPDSAVYEGSKVVLRFEDKAPIDLTADRLKEYLTPVLDFDKQNFMDSGIESLPEEFQEAVLDNEPKIGMDRSTVLAAMGRPHSRIRDRTPEGIEQETWIYEKLGFGAGFIYFEGDFVVKIVRY